jgi:hypothetical protein
MNYISDKVLTSSMYTIKTKTKHWLSPQKAIMLIALVSLVVLSLFVQVRAQTLAQGFAADQALERGIIVVLDDEDPTRVQPATLERVEDLYGVVINKNDASVTLSEECSDVFVATNGPYRVLVSTQNGAIEPGDFITVSSLEGIGMKTNDIAPVVIGRAMTGFDGSNAASTAQAGESTVSIGRIDLDVLASNNPLQKPAEANLPSFLRSAAEAIAGKPVPAARVYISVFVLLIAAVVSGSLMYSGVRSSIISIGRNPLSKKSIIKSMIQVILVGLIIFIIGVFGVYLILRV